MKKKLLALAGTVVLALSMAAGCGASVSAQSLLQEADDNVKNAKSVDGHMKMDMNAVSDTVESGETASADESLTLGMDMDMQATQDPSAAYMKGKVSMLGMDIDTEIYTVPEDGQTCTYLGMLGQWMVEKSSAVEEAAQQLDGTSSSLLAHAKDLQVEKGTQDVDGKKAYIITGTLQGEDLKDLADSAQGAMSSLTGTTEDMDYSNLSVDVEYAVSVDDKMPLYVDLKFKGLAAERVRFDTFNMRMDYKSFDSVEKIEVPADVKEQAQDIS